MIRMISRINPPTPLARATYHGTSVSTSGGKIVLTIYGMHADYVINIVFGTCIDIYITVYHRVAIALIKPDS